MEERGRRQKILEFIRHPFSSSRSRSVDYGSAVQPPVPVPAPTWKSHEGSSTASRPVAPVNTQTPPAKHLAQSPPWGTSISHAELVKKQWEEAYQIAKDVLEEDEHAWLEEARACVAENSPMKVVEEARVDMLSKQWISRETREKILDPINKYVGIVDAGMQYSPDIAAAVWGGVRVILGASIARSENLSIMEEAISAISVNMAYAEFYASMCSELQTNQDQHHKFEPLKEAMNSTLPKFYAAVLVFSVKAKGFFTTTRLQRALRDFEPFLVSMEPYITDIDMNRDELEKLANVETMQRIKDNSKDVQNILQVVEELRDHLRTLNRMDRNIQDVRQIVDDSAEEQYLDKLARAKGASFHAHIRQYKPLCLEHTRVALLEEIQDWYTTDSPVPCVYWLNGMAGTGKSTIARTVASKCDGQEILGASFFFTRGQADLSSSAKLFTTLAAQLAQKVPGVKSEICAAIKGNPDINDQLPSEQWGKLIKKPLSLLDGRPRTVVFVIDALDECLNEDVKGVLALFSEANTFPGVRLRILVTSRPENHIGIRFKEFPESVHHSFKLHAISDNVVEKDIEQYLSHMLGDIRKDRSLPADWPGEQNIKIITKNSAGLFIYAATMCRFIGDEDFSPKKRLSRLLQGGGDHQSAIETLDEMYLEILRTSMIEGRREWVIEEISERFKLVVGAVLTLYIPFAEGALNSLLNTDEIETRATFNSLRSVLDIPEGGGPVRLLHASFRDFLLQRCEDDRLRIDERKCHEELLLRCLSRMSQTLRRNICDHHGRTDVHPRAVDIKAKLESYLPSDVQYACQYWVYHFKESGTTLHANKVQAFLETHILHWLEALGWMGMSSEAVRSAQALWKYVEPTTECIQLRNLALDIQYFTSENRGILEQHPLHLYISSLVFSARNSLVRKLSSRYSPDWIRIFPPVRKEWPSVASSVLEGHRMETTSVAFSVTGKLATASYDGQIILWDPSTGALDGILANGLSCPQAVTFSGDGALIAAACDDNAIRIWDVSTRVLRVTLNGHSKGVSSVAFSPDSKLLCSGSHDTTVRTWDATTGEPRNVLEGHEGFVESVAFSADGKTIASGSSDLCVRLWDPSSGECCNVLGRHDLAVRSVAFSREGNLLATASEDNTVRIWDLLTDTILHVLKGHSDTVSCVAFAPNNSLLLSGSYDKTVRMWSPTTGDCLGLLRRHPDPVTSIAIDSSGSMAASTCSNYGYVMSWGTETSSSTPGKESSTAPSAHAGPINFIAFSPDGKLVASSSFYDNTVRIWDATTGTTKAVLEGHSDRVVSTSFSGGNKLLASTSWDKTVRLWDIETHEEVESISITQPNSNLVFADSILQSISRRGSNNVQILKRFESSDWDATYSTALNLARLHIADGWLNYNYDTPILRLPLECQPISTEVHGNKIAVATRLGTVVFFEVDPSVGLVMPQ